MGRNIIASTSADLKYALSIVKGGDSILLASGNYSNIEITGKKYAGGITITSLNSDSPAVLDNIILRNSSDIKFTNLEFNILDDIVPNRFSPMLYAQSTQNISIDNVVFKGANVSDGVRGAGNIVGEGVFVNFGSNWSITNSEFFGLKNAVMMHNTSGIDINKNQIHDYRADGLYFAMVEGVHVANNTIERAFPIAGDHPDFIQFGNAYNVVVENNFLSQGSGASSQGIVFGATGGFTLGSGTILVQNNIVNTSATNAILLSDVPNGIIRHNTVLWNEPHTGAVTTIRLKGEFATDASIYSNVFNGFGTTYQDLKSLGTRYWGNTFVERNDTSSALHYSKLFKGSMDGQWSTPDDFRLLKSAFGDVGVDFARFSLPPTTIDPGKGDGSPRGGPASPDLEINFQKTPVEKYSARLQDRGDARASADGDTLSIYNNAWKKVSVDLHVGAETHMTFKMKIDQLAEIHAIGFETDEFATENRFFTLAGSESWGDEQHRRVVKEGEWVKFDIAVGESFTGNFDRLVFVADSDSVIGGAAHFADVAFYDLIA